MHGEPTDAIDALLANAPSAFVPPSTAASLSALRELGKSATYNGTLAFRLYDTFGLPKDFIEDACRDAGIIFDSAGFDLAMEEQRTRARASWKGAAKQTANPAYQDLKTRVDPSVLGTIVPNYQKQSVFIGYELTKILACDDLCTHSQWNRD